MKYFLSQIQENIVDTDEIIYYCDRYDEYGITVHDSDSRSYILIQYCPWCGKKLPDSKRELWFQELEARGIEDINDERIPADFLSDKWWQNLE